jgi:predicted lipoprotein with Yx(FWY)xxD motif
MRSRTLIVAPFVIVALVAACSSSGSSPSVASQAPASVAPATQAPASVTPSAAPSAAPTASAAAAGKTVEAKPVGAQGTVLVAGSNGMTVYTFTKDVKDSGKSACSGQCLTTWPALTVSAGATPAAGTGVTGKLGTITRDDGTLQVTYNGLPLYFFKNDNAPGDANGVYANWQAVKP